jgi:hypothetical protein
MCLGLQVTSSQDMLPGYRVQPDEYGLNTRGCTYLKCWGLPLPLKTCRMHRVRAARYPATGRNERDGTVPSHAYFGEVSNLTLPDLRCGDLEFNGDASELMRTWSVYSSGTEDVLCLC